MKRRPGMRRFTRYSLFIVCLIIALLTIPIAAQNGAKKPAKDVAGKGEWRYYGGDGGSTKYSPLDQINKENAGKLKVAWAWDSRSEERRVGKGGRVRGGRGEVEEKGGSVRGERD